jgi:hypothetical protein
MKNMDVPASFRDPSGSVYYEDGILYRRVNPCYKENYDLFFNSGLYHKLVSSGLIIPHVEIKNNEISIYKVLKPELIPFISYPYEWCFSQLKEAALLTLKIQKFALGYGMSLKDCSLYNIQFLGPKPVFIDTLSFEKCISNHPWVAYGQFCRHFLAPLALMGMVDIRLGQLLKSYIDGLPLDLSALLLPYSGRFNIGLLLHIYMHSRAERTGLGVSSVNGRVKNSKFGINSFYGLVDNLESTIQGIRWKPFKTNWVDYYLKKESYSSQSINHKRQIIEEMLHKISPRTVCDLGANIGLFSRIFSSKGIYTVSTDLDPVCVEGNYLYALEHKEKDILPLLLDVVNPSPAIGWENGERDSFIERGPFDLVMALALIHHLAISNNVPFGKISFFLKKITQNLIIEFVPKDDAMVQEMLIFREDIFKEYTQENFENEFGKYFSIDQAVRINDSKRILYLMHRKG